MSSFDPLIEGFDLRLAADREVAEFGEARFHRLLLLLGGLSGAALDGEFGAEFVERFHDVLLAADHGVRLGLQTARFVFESFEAIACAGEFLLHVLAALGGGALAVFKFAALPFDVFELGFEILHLAGGEAELALEG